jgi:thiol-disulfide isomerase/thioredoxin
MWPKASADIYKYYVSMQKRFSLYLALFYTENMVVKPINSYAEFKAIISQDKLVIIHFWATWAGACKVISPVFERFSNTYEGADYYKVDVDEQVVSIQKKLLAKLLLSI